MILRRSYLGICLIAGSLLNTASLGAQSSPSITINGPSLGFTPDGTGSTIWPIVGIPGASFLGANLALESEIRGAVISPSQNYAIAARTADAQPIVIDFVSGTPAATPISGAHAGADLMAVSPTGSAAAIYDQQSGSIQVIGGFPHSAYLLNQFDASSISGFASHLSISDDGAVAVILFSEPGGMGLWSLSNTSAPRRIQADQPSAAAFFPGKLDIVVSDNALPGAFLVTDVNRTATRLPLTSGTSKFSSVATADDGQQVFLADSQKGTITIVDLRTGQSTLLSCTCKPTGFYHLKGISVFRLNEPVYHMKDSPGARIIAPSTALRGTSVPQPAGSAFEPTMVLDAGSGEARIMITPPPAPSARQPRSR